MMTTELKLHPYMDNGQLKYAPLSNMPPHSVIDGNDSDSNVPLVSSSALVAGADSFEDDSIQRFTATGRPMPEYKQSSWQSLSGAETFVGAPPQHIPTKFTDDSIVSVSVALSPSPAMDVT